MQRNDRWLIGWGLGYAAIGAVSLLVPLYALTLGAGPLLIGIMASSAAFAGVPGALLWGKLAARTPRRRPFVLIALATAALVIGVVPLLTDPIALLVANAAIWFVVSAAAPVLNLIVVEGAPESEWTVRIGRLNAAQGYGWVLGLLLGTVWTAVAPRVLSPPLAQRSLFLVLAGVTLLALVLTRIWYPAEPSTSPEQFRRVYRRLRRSRWGAGRYLRSIPYGPERLYWGLLTLRRRGLPNLSAPLGRYLLATALFSTGFAVFWGPMPAYLTTQRYATGTIFVLFLLANVGSAVCYTSVGSLSTRIPPKRLQSLALLARVFLFPLVAFVGAGALGVAFPLLAVCFLLIGVTWAVIAVTATGIVTGLAEPAFRGDALGMYTAIVGVGTGVGSALGGAIARSLGYVPTFGFAGLCVLGGAGLVVTSALVD